MASKLWIALFILTVQRWTSARVVSQNLAVHSDPVNFSGERFGESGGVETHGNPLKCLQYVTPAYETAKEVRKVLVESVAYVQTVNTGFKACIDLEGFEKPALCLYNLGKDQYSKGKEQYGRMKTVTDKAKEILDSFDKCMD